MRNRPDERTEWPPPRLDPPREPSHPAADVATPLDWWEQWKEQRGEWWEEWKRAHGIDP